MKKVINITLGSIVFAVEQDAFGVLEAYLASIKANLGETDDSAEVVDDIERAIAEKFIAHKRSEKVAVTTADVQQVMSEMGSPAEFGDTAQEATDQLVDQSAESGEQKKRLYRDPEDVIIAGVASGLANYFNIDPVIVRLLFVVSVFFNGIGILAYLLLWFVVPAAKTTAEKYAMRGERVTLREISERVQTKIKEVERTDLSAPKGAWSGLRGVLNRIFTFLGQLIRYVLKAARYLFGFVFLVGGALGVAALVSAYTIVLLSNPDFIPVEVQTALDIMLGGTLGLVAISASFVMMLIPLLVLVLTGGGLLARRNLFTVGKSITLAVVWIISLVLAGTTSALLVQQVMPAIDPELFDNGRLEIEWNEQVYQAPATPSSPAAPTAPTAPQLPEGVEFSAAQIDCFETTLGQDRVDAIARGATPTPSELLAGRNCL